LTFFKKYYIIILRKLIKTKGVKMYMNYNKLMEHFGDNEWVNNNFLDLFDETEESFAKALQNASLEGGNIFEDSELRNIVSIAIAYLAKPEFFDMNNKLELYKKLMEDDEFLSLNSFLLAMII
jgi:hypothetical protein